MKNKSLHVKKYEVVLVIDGLHVKNIEPFEKHLKKEGFLRVENEEFAYVGKGTLSLMHTRAFIFETLKQAMKLSSTNELMLSCLMGGNPLEYYFFDNKEEVFKEIKG